MLFMKIVAFIFLIAGFGLVFVARGLVKKFKLDKNIKCDFENELSEEEVQKYKSDKAAVNLKMLGMIVALPGLILVVIAFK